MAMTDGGDIDWVKALGGKVTLLPGYATDLSAATFCLAEEDHTLGNSLRYMLMKDEQVEFCGYSLPHPSENKCHLRVQMYDRADAVAALQRALLRLEQLFERIKSTYEQNLSEGEFERFNEAKTDLQSILERQAAAQAAREAASGGVAAATPSRAQR